MSSSQPATSQRPAPAHLPGTLLAAARSRCSRHSAVRLCKRQPTRGRGRPPGSGSPTARPYGNAAATPRSEVLDPRSARQVRPTLGGLEPWPIRSFRGAREPAHPPTHPARASIEVGRPEGSASGRSPVLQSRTHPRVHLPVFFSASSKNWMCCSLVKEQLGVKDIRTPR